MGGQDKSPVESGVLSVVDSSPDPSCGILSGPSCWKNSQGCQRGGRHAWQEAAPWRPRDEAAHLSPRGRQATREFGQGVCCSQRDPRIWTSALPASHFPERKEYKMPGPWAQAQLRNSQKEREHLLPIPSQSGVVVLENSRG